MSPDGSRVFATGYTIGAGTLHDYTTVAYDPSNGSELWVARYNGLADASDVANALVVSPDGSHVFVTGSVADITTGFDYGTVAYDASTGTQLWGERYTGSGSGDDTAVSVAVSPGGSSVFVTGASTATNGVFDYATVAYDASTGAGLWTRRYNGAANGNDAATSLAVSPGGSTVFVTGASLGVSGFNDWATVAYDAATGSSVWVRRYNGPHGVHDGANSIAVSPGGAKVFVTGFTDCGTTDLCTHADYASAAYDAATGSRIWSARYNGAAKSSDFAYWLAVSPGGSTVFVTGASDGPNGDADWATVAYSA